MIATIRMDISNVLGVTTTEITDMLPALSVVVAEEQEVHATNALVVDNTGDRIGPTVADIRHGANLIPRNKRERKILA